MRTHLNRRIHCVAFAATAQEKLSVALDWTWRNHVGLYVAQAKGLVEGRTDVDILPYTDTSSGTLVATGVARLLASAVGFHNATSADMTVVMAVVQRNRAACL
jgi:ABC-type nitrate/sulfonate/bicarbonate transport system substrate-binding protein